MILARHPDCNATVSKGNPRTDFLPPSYSSRCLPWLSRFFLLEGMNDIDDRVLQVGGGYMPASQDMFPT